MRWMTLSLLFIIAAYAMVACNEPMTAISVVDKFRIMAVQVEPPEIRPGQSTTHRLLYADPTGDGRKVTAMWVTLLGDISPTAQVPAEGLTVMGLQLPSPAETEYTTFPMPMNILDALPQGRDYLSATSFLILCAGGEIQLPTNIDMAGTGDFMTLLQGAFTGESDQLCKGGDLLTVIKKFRISNQGDALRNTNPSIDTVTFDKRLLMPVGESMPSEGDTDTLPIEDADAGADAGDGGDVPEAADDGSQNVDAGTGEAMGVFVCDTTDDCLIGVKISAKLTKESFESYENVAFGKTDLVDESLYISWFATGGAFDRDRAGVNPKDQSLNVKWAPPLRGGTHTMWAVAHDLRGGTSWKKYVISGVTPPM